MLSNLDKSNVRGLNALIDSGNSAYAKKDDYTACYRVIGFRSVKSVVQFKYLNDGHWYDLKGYTVYFNV